MDKYHCRAPVGAELESGDRERQSDVLGFAHESGNAKDSQSSLATSTTHTNCR